MRDRESVETDIENTGQWRHVEKAHSGIICLFVHFF